MSASWAPIEGAVFALPPWPRTLWHDDNRVTARSLRSADDLGLLVQEWAAEIDLRPDFENAESCGISAVISGEGDFDNAMGTRLYSDENQEMSVYLLRGGVPEAEINLANLCAWASAAKRGGRGEAISDGRLLHVAADLAAFADGHRLRQDWHEPDEQELTATASGRLLDRSSAGLVVELCHADWHPTKSEHVPGALLAEVWLADLLSWTLGQASPPPPAPAAPAPRRRPSALASRQS